MLNATEKDVDERVVTDIPAVSPIASKVPALFRRFQRRLKSVTSVTFSEIALDSVGFQAYFP